MLRDNEPKITLDDAAIIAVGVGAIYQLFNIKVPRIVGIAGTVFTLIAMQKAVNNILVANVVPKEQPTLATNTEPTKQTLKDVLG